MPLFLGNNHSAPTWNCPKMKQQTPQSIKESGGFPKATV